MAVAQKTSEPMDVEGETLDQILGTPGITISADDEDDTKNKFLDREKDDLAFIEVPGEAETKDDPDDDEPLDPGEDPNTEEHVPTPDDEPLDLGEPGEEDDEGDDPSKAGRKPALIETIGKLVKKGTLELFEGEDDITKYSNDDIVELIEANISSRVQKVANDAPMEIFSKLDKKLQNVVAYNLKGGKDIIPMLKSITASQEISELNLENENDQERIVREYYRSIDWDEEDINSEVTSLQDREELEKKATQFKPKLDAKSDQILQKKIEEQDAAKKRADQMKMRYAETIHNVLDNDSLNGIPLNNRVQTQLYRAMINTGEFQDRNGNPTNTLGHMIEELQFGEKPNHALLLEATWLMTNPKEYHEAIGSVIQKKEASATYRNLKTTAATRRASSSAQGNGVDNSKKRDLKSPSVKRSFLSRN